MRIRVPVIIFLLLGLNAGATEPVTEYAQKAIVRYQQREAPAAGSIIFFGSSSIDMWRPLADDFPGLPVVNRGMGGTQLSDAVFLGEALVFPYSPRAVVLYAGENDLPVGKSTADVVAAFLRFQTAFHASIPGTPLLFIALKPSIKRVAYLETMREINAAIAAHCKEDPAFTFVDVFTPMLGANGLPCPDIFIADELHMNAAGYALWKRVVDPALRAVLE